MKSRKIISPLVILLVTFFALNNLFGYAYAYTSSHRSPGEIMADRYNSDDNFKAKVNFAGIVLFFVILLSFLSVYLGINLGVVWAFIGGFFLTEALAVSLYFLGINLFGVYGFFASIGVAIWCAYSVHAKQKQ